MAEHSEHGSSTVHKVEVALIFVLGALFLYALLEIYLTQ